MALKDELRQRWTVDRARDAKEALENWKKPNRLEQVAFGQHEGRLDLRGLTIYTAISGVRKEHVSAGSVNRDYEFVTLDSAPEFHNVVWEAIDFTYAEIDHLRFFLSELRDCKFNSAILRDMRIWGTRFVDCDFSQVNLQGSNVGGAEYKGKRVEYTNCTWRKGNLKSIYLSGGTYRDCAFEDVRLVNEQVKDARFSNCVFSGRLKEIRFDGRDLSRKGVSVWDARPDAVVDCDFTGCVLEDCEFSGIDVRRITLPPGGIRVQDIASVARRALDWSTTADLGEGDRMFLKIYWTRYLTTLPSDAETWLDPDAVDGRARELVDQSLALPT